MPVMHPFRRLLPGPGNTSGIDGGMLSAIPETLVDFIQCASVTITTAQIESMFTTGITLLAAPAISGRSNVLLQALVRVNPGATQFTAGGAVQIQYSTTGNNGGTLIGATIPAATINSASSSDILIAPGTSTTVTNGGVIAITNATQLFATGNGSITVYMWYSQI